MIQNDSAAVVLSLTVSMLGIWYLFFYQYQDYRRDRLRAELFSIRAELFDAAADGLIAFDHPAYGQLRRVINGFLRFGYRMGAMTLLGCALVGSRMGSITREYEAQWAEALGSLDPEVRARLEGLQRRVFSAFLRHVLCTSAFTALPLAAVCLLVKRLFDHWGGDRPSFSSRIESAAFAAGVSR